MSHLPIERSITFLHTRDLTETSRFYEEVLGLTLKLDQGSCRIYRLGTDAHIGFCERDESPVERAEPSSEPVILTFVTEEVDAWFEHLVARGVDLEAKPAVNARYNIYHFFLRDIEFQRFLHPF